MTENPNFAAVFEAGGKFRALPILLGFSPYRLLGGVGQIGRRPAKAPLPRSRDRDSSCWWAVASRHLAFLAAFLVSRTAATRAFSVAGSTRGGGFLRPR